MLQSIQGSLNELKAKLSKESRTSKLWIEYQRIVAVIRKFIRADCLGLWDVHLEAIQEALPIFAAVGHFNYTKSAYLYLQTMKTLESTQPEVFQYSKSGGFLVRCSERHWAGEGCDLTIEQALMRSLKTTGGLS